MTQITATSFLIRAADAWWSSRTPEQKKAYIAKHPGSKYAKQGSGKPTPKKPEAKKPRSGDWDSPEQELEDAEDQVQSINDTIDRFGSTPEHVKDKKDLLLKIKKLEKEIGKPSKPAPKSTKPKSKDKYSWLK